MSDPLALDLFIQDFVNTNRVLGWHYKWESIVNRRFLEDGLIKVFSFQSGGALHYAIGTHLALPDSDWLRIELTRPIPVVEGEHRFECLRMTQAATHTGIEIEKIGENTILVKLTTRHRGLINVVFVVRDAIALNHPFLT